MQENDRLKLTPEEEQEKAEEERLMGALRDFNEAQGTNRPITELFPDIKFIGISDLESAASSGKTWRVKVALQKDNDVNEKNADGETPLHHAVENGHLEIVRLLVEHGADTQAETDDGKTALQIAETENQTEIVEYLKSLE
jgi:ankyrin repeat protein